jgi:hypothetical protein
VLVDPEVVAGARAAGVELSPTTSAEFGRFIGTETTKWADVIKRSGTQAGMTPAMASRSAAPDDLPVSTDLMDPDPARHGPAASRARRDFQPSGASAAPMSTPPTRLEADVAIVGAGPVGLTLALDLAQRGCSVAMLETRRRGEPPNVKCNHVAARTMEQFRRLGVGADVRNAGLPPDYPNDVVFRTAVTGTELARIHIPGRATRLHRHPRPRRLVADAGAAAPHQPDLPRADLVRALPRRGAA